MNPSAIVKRTGCRVGGDPAALSSASGGGRV